MTASLSLPGDSDPYAEVDPWQARIVDGQGRLLGSGVLISDRYVLTCAHVLDRGESRPTTTFRIGFPRSDAGFEIVGRVAVDGWFPGSSIDERDVAILELEQPATGVRHAGLSRGKRRGRGTAVEVFGHTRHLFNGVSVRAEISHTVGPKNQRVQLSPTRDLAPEAVVAGFSGGGVLDMETGQVLGIVATTQADAERTVAFMIPMETVGAYWPRLFAWLDESVARESSVPALTVEQIATLLGLRAAMGRAESRRWVAERLPGSASSRLTSPTPSVHDLVQACKRPLELRILADLVLYLEDAPAGFGPIEDLLAEIGAERPEPTSQPETIGPRTQQELRRLLLHQSYFVDRATRGFYLAALRRRLRRERELEVDLAATDSAEDDARALIELCLMIPGALRMILLDFPYAESRTAEFGLLWMVIEEITPRLVLTDDERDDLLRQLAGVPASRLALAHQRAIPTSVESTPGPADLAGLIRRVEGYNQRAGELPRVFVFVEHLALELAGESAAKLRRWQDRVAARMRLHSSVVREMRHGLAEERVSDAATGTPILRIQLAPDLRSTDQYLLTVILDHGSVPEPLERSHQPLPIEENLTRLRAVLDARSDRLLPHLASMAIEVVVPRALLTEPVDQWEVPALADEPIGSRYPVVLRSYERLHQRRYHKRWERKSRLVRQLAEPSAEVVRFVGPEERPNPRVLWEQLRGDDTLVLVCGRPPVQQPRLTPPDEYAAALEAGVPYVMWVRDARLAGELREWVESTLATALVRDLPDRVAEYRSTGWLDPAGEDGLSSQMAIMACHTDRDAAFTDPFRYAPGGTST
ncbi:MAG: trypsin-like peptidase domain-containing protein [Actinoplanes sp.]